MCSCLVGCPKPDERGITLQVADFSKMPKFADPEGQAKSVNFSVVTALTKKAVAIALLPWGMSLWLLFLAVGTFRQFSPLDSSRWAFVIPPMGISIALLVISVMVYRRYCGITISISPTHLIYQGKGKDQTFSAAWKSLIYTPPRNAGGFLNTLILADRDNAVAIYDLFTPNFLLLCREVAKRKTNAISADSMGNMILDSTKLR
jgi:hypothetical protein